jgi:hypothetical protein
MDDERARTFSRAFKLRASERMGATENVSALSCELGVKRESYVGYEQEAASRRVSE